MGITTLAAIDNISGLMGSFLIAGIVLGAAAIAYPVVMILRLIRKPMAIKSAEKAALEQRGGQKQQVRVRQTDIESNLTRKDRIVFQQAEHLVLQRKFLEASQLFESIKFQRRAIDVLEHNGLIDDAAAILLRMNIPQRAAVVYERNNMLEPAAHFYTQANMPDKAGQAYLSLGKSDYRFYQKAIDCFQKVDYVEGLLKASSKLLNTEFLIKTCLEKKKFGFLFDYLRDPSVAAKALGTMTQPQLKTLIDEISLSPLSVRTYINWVWVYPKEDVVLKILSKVHLNQDMCRYFWQNATAEVKIKLIRIFEEQSPYLEQSVAFAHCRALMFSGEAAKSELILQKLGAHRQLACLYVESSQLPACQQLLKEVGETVLAQKFAELLAAHPNPPWNNETLSYAYNIAKEVKIAPKELDPLSNKPPVEVELPTIQTLPKAN